MVGDADRGLVDVVPLVRFELLVAEGRDLGHEPAVLGANVEAGADLVCDACAIHGAD